jgi:hypothetical protein
VLAAVLVVTGAGLGVATGALNFFKTMGGAFGAALFGAILAAQLDGRPPGTPGYRHGFQTVFLWTVPFMVLALILAVAMPEQPLSQQMREVAAGKTTDVAEY